MAGFRLGSDYLKRGFTLVDNEFLLGYLPSANPVDVKIYCYGLALGGGAAEAETLGEIAVRLKLTPERVEEGLKTLEDAGLLIVNALSPLDVVYRAVRAPVPKRAAEDLKKYSGFQNDMIQLFPDKFLVPNDVVPFMELLNDTKTEPTALLQIVQYCIRLKGEKVSTPYILAVANNWISEGVRTEKAVEERIERLDEATSELTELLNALGVKSAATLEDRDRYENWRRGGFTKDALLSAAKLAKRTGGTAKLDRITEELRGANAFTPEEIEAYRKNKEFRRTLAADLVKNLGTYYASLDAAVETYVLPWLQEGFEPNGLLLLSKLAFKRSVKTLAGLDALVKKFFRLGLVTEAGIAAYVDKTVAADEAVQTLLETAGAPRYVSNRDRELYRVWIEDWKLPHDVLTEAAGLSVGKPYPMSVMNGILLSYKSTGKLAPPGKPGKKTAPPIEEHAYNREELNALFRGLTPADEVEV